MRTKPRAAKNQLKEKKKTNPHLYSRFRLLTSFLLFICLFLPLAQCTIPCPPERINQNTVISNPLEESEPTDTACKPQVLTLYGFSLLHFSESPFKSLLHLSLFLWPFPFLAYRRYSAHQLVKPYLDKVEGMLGLGYLYYAYVITSPGKLLFGGYLLFITLSLYLVDVSFALVKHNKPKKIHIYYFLIAVLCFSIHLGITISNTYLFASKRNTITFPHVKGYSEPQRWHNFLDLNRWDSSHYERAVLLGFRNPNDPSKPLNTVQWFPGYPLTAKLLHTLIQKEVTFTFSLLSVICTLAFWMFLWSPKMVAAFGIKVLALTSTIIICWPGGFFWFSGMTEPLVSLLLLLVIYFGVDQQFNRISCLLAYGSSVKQVFVPLALAILVIDYIRNKPNLIPLITRFFFALTGFIAFGVYCWWAFNNFFISSDMQLSAYHKKLSLLNLIDLQQYARHFWGREGMIAFVSMLFLLSEALRIPNFWDVWKEGLNYHKPVMSLPNEITLWWIALTCTTFFIFGSAYDQNPFASMMRYQTTNIAIFLLLAYRFKNIAWWKIAVLFFPICWVALYWQNKFVVIYWQWEWVS